MHKDKLSKILLTKKMIDKSLRNNGKDYKIKKFIDKDLSKNIL